MISIPYIFHDCCKELQINFNICHSNDMPSLSRVAYMQTVVYDICGSFPLRSYINQVVILWHVLCHINLVVYLSKPNLSLYIFESDQIITIDIVNAYAILCYLRNFITWLYIVISNWLVLACLCHLNAQGEWWWLIKALGVSMLWLKGSQ